MRIKDITRYKVKLIPGTSNKNKLIEKWFLSISKNTFTITLTTLIDGQRMISVLGQKNITNDLSENNETLIIHTLVELFGTEDIRLYWLRKTKEFKSLFFIKKLDGYASPTCNSLFTTDKDKDKDKDKER